VPLWRCWYTPSLASTPRFTGERAGRRPATGSGSPCPGRSCNRPTAPGSATSPWSSLPSSPTTTRRSTARQSIARPGLGVRAQGLFYNESDLELQEHYTDTHGYTEINFAAFAMVGRRFCPRIRGLGKQRLYRLDTKREYGPLPGLVSRADRTRSTPRSSLSSGTGWGSSMHHSRVVTRPLRSRSKALPHAPPRTASTGPIATWAGFSRPSSCSATCPSPRCGPASGRVC